MSTLPVFEYANAKDVPQAISQLGDDWKAAVVYAGGIDLLDLMKERLVEPKRLVNIKQNAALNYVKRNADGTTRIGPLVTLAQVAEHEDLRKTFPAFAEACGRAATPQVRNLATLGGNLCQRPRCWYFRHEEFPCLRKGGSRCFAKEGENKYHAVFHTDESCIIVHPSAAAVGLTALDAQVKIMGRAGERTLSLEKFFVMPHDDMLGENVLKPDELITEIIIPSASRGLKNAYVKQREKQTYDWPLADVAAAIGMSGGTIETARVVLGSAAQVPYRATKAEEFLKGKPLSLDTATRAGELAVEDNKPVAQNGYKVPLFKVIVRRTLMALIEEKVG